MRSEYDSGFAEVPSSPNVSVAAREAGWKVDQSILYMQQHLSESLPVAQLAATAKVSPSHYFALFKRRTGWTPIGFFIRLRMREACLLLEGTALNVKQVAAELGYDDQFYFSRLFKSITQASPSDYRALPPHSRADIRAAILPEAAVDFAGNRIGREAVATSAELGQTGVARSANGMPKSADVDLCCTP